ncbi:MAG: hypothetical protein AMS16_02050 [Planctomycetes bacterium DG_58]|nr:MAG: hypothetical protein AMS16_02050 [Planctomycetes bacterium DG_58]
MRTTVTIALCVLGLLTGTAELGAQGPRRGRATTADDLIKRHVAVLIKNQDKNGRWTHQYELGMTGLAVLALKHSNDPRATEAIIKGVDYICQQNPERKTYSAGTIVSALYQVNPRAHRRTINTYASLLVKSQQGGMFGYNLKGHPSGFTRGDNSNTQFGVLGLLFAQRAGFQVPTKVWEGLKRHYTRTQNKDGGWGYQAGGNSYHNMTLASTVSLYLAEEHLALGASAKCAMTPPSRATEAAMKWVGSHFTTDLDPYGIYAMERLGILTGRSEFGGHYWYRECSEKLLKSGATFSRLASGDAGNAFLILFLSRGKEPVVINKLRYYGDWDCAHYDVKHMTDYISDNMQSPMQWRVVTLQSSLDDLLKVPILHYHGIKGPQFTDDEKIKIRNYVLRGGVLMVQACRCWPQAKEFRESFQALMEECFPESDLEELPASHRMFKTPRRLGKPPKVMVMKFKGAKFNDRIGVVYLPTELSIDWHRGGRSAKPAFDAGVNIIFYILKQAGRLGAGAKPIHD